MQLLNKDLEFWNKEQRLIVKWLDDEDKALRNIKYLEWKNLTEQQKSFLLDYKTLKNDASRENNKYYKSLINIKADNILDEIIRPFLEERKRYIENNFDIVLNEKRRILLEQLKRKFPERKETDFILPF